MHNAVIDTLRKRYAEFDNKQAGQGQLMPMISANPLDCKCVNEVQICRSGVGNSSRPAGMVTLA